MSDDLTLDSLQRRMKALHSLYRDAVATMELHHVNHFEREGVLPIAFSLFHIVNMIMKVAPIGAFGAMAFTIGKHGVGSLAQLAQLMGTFYATCLIFVTPSPTPDARQPSSRRLSLAACTPPG